MSGIHILRTKIYSGTSCRAENQAEKALDSKNKKEVRNQQKDSLK